MKNDKARLAVEDLRNQIQLIRGMPVITDADLALAYGVTTKALNQAVKRNQDRFPSEFVFRLDSQGVAVLKSQIVTSSCGVKRSPSITESSHGGRRKSVYVFTEHGAIMASMVLNSPQAVRMSVFVVKAFIAMRSLLVTQQGLAKKLAELERSLTERLDTHEHAITDIIQQIMRLLSPSPEPESEPQRPSIGFGVRETRAVYGTRIPRRTIS
jgi:ORF6N domain